jgi:hypothetical protein
MKITPPADDYGTETLRRNNQEKSVQESDHVEPYPPITPQQRRSPLRPLVERRRHGERRQQERRKRKGRTLHSTRLQQERRTHLRRKSDLRTATPAKESEGSDVTVSKRGIDEFA